MPFGCRSTLVRENMDQNLRDPPLFNFEPHPFCNALAMHLGGEDSDGTTGLLGGYIWGMSKTQLCQKI